MNETERIHVERGAPRRRGRGRAASRLAIGLAATFAVLFSTLGLARYLTFHNETFDLAFYARIAWGFAHLELWEPMVNAHFYGLHISPVLAPLGVLGYLVDIPGLLIVAQGVALAATAWPLAKIGNRHLGPYGALAGTLAWLCYPNLAHVAGYEFHPGSLAVFALAWMAFGIDRGCARAFWLGALGAVLCREDLTLVTLFGAGLYASRHREQVQIAARVGGASLLYALLFFFVLHPIYAPEHGSLELHFPRGITHFVTHPSALFVHLVQAPRLAYVPKVLLPLAFLPLARSRWLLPTVPIIAMNLLSAWPTTTDLDVHYLTPALPFLVAGALDGAGRLSRRAAHLPRHLTLLLAVVPPIVGHLIAGGSPLSLDFDARAFTRDANYDAARAIVERVGPDASVQAPYRFLAHFASRSALHRTSSPEANDDYYVLDVAHRRRYAGNEDLIRTVEEPHVRDWLARPDHAVVLARGDYLLLERGRDPRDGVGGRALVGAGDPSRARRIAACLGVEGARIVDGALELTFFARGPCPGDLVIRLGRGARPRRVDLLFGGILSPAHLRAGDRLVSAHPLDDRERDAFTRDGAVRVGAVRQSGARPEHADPVAVTVPIRRDRRR